MARERSGVEERRESSYSMKHTIEIYEDAYNKVVQACCEKEVHRKKLKKKYKEDEKTEAQEE